jgi:predicted dinucleotide-binding enzyme
VTLAERGTGSASVARALGLHPNLTARPLAEAVESAEVVFLATPFAALATLLPSIAPDLSGKILVDCTNPVGPGLTHGLNSEQSGAAVVQRLVPSATVVKAFTIYGFENFEHPEYPGYPVKPVMLFAGDDARAKAVVSTLIADCGFEPLDVGGLVQALHLEHMTLLWIRMVRAGGGSPRTVWAVLRGDAPSS